MTDSASLLVTGVLEFLLLPGSLPAGCVRPGICPFRPGCICRSTVVHSSLLEPFRFCRIGRNSPLFWSLNLSPVLENIPCPREKEVCSGAFSVVCEIWVLAVLCQSCFLPSLLSGLSITESGVLASPTTVQGWLCPSPGPSGLLHMF